MVNGRVVALGTCDAAGEPMRAAAHLELAAGVGVVGDRYATGRGFFNGYPDMELTLVTEEAAKAAGVDALALRRNVVTRDVDLDDFMGHPFTIGDVALEGVRPCDPCEYLGKMLDVPGLKAALHGRGGLRARVIGGGTIRVGDAVVGR